MLRNLGRALLVLGFVALAACAELTGAPSSGAPAAADQPAPPPAVAEEQALPRPRAGLDAPGAAELVEGLALLDRDQPRAAAFIRRAAEAGNAEAQFQLSQNPVLRPPGQQDGGGARAWLAAAAMGGHARAQRTLADLYANAAGARPEQGWATMWYERAARRGDGPAAAILAHRLAAGASPDAAGAYRWALIAADLGAPLPPALRVTLAAGVRSARQRDEIEREVRNWGPVLFEAYPDPPLIRYVQQALNDVGQDAGPADGLLGPRTRAALERYAARFGLSPQISPALVVRLRQG